MEIVYAISTQISCIIMEYFIVDFIIFLERHNILKYKMEFKFYGTVF